MADPTFANVGLLLHCNGTDASTSFPDSSLNAHTVTAVGNAQVDTAQSKWGGASAYFDGNGDRLTVPFASSFDLTSGDFTIECWVRFEYEADLWSPSWILTQPAASGLPCWQLFADAPGDSYYHMGFSAVNASNVQIVSLAHTANLVQGTWYHVAVTRSGSTWRLFVAGASPASGTSSASLKTTTQPLRVGDSASGTAGHWGWIDDIRIKKGEALYTAAFTPPTAEFEEGGISGYVAVPSPLGAALLLGSANRINVRASAPSPLGSPRLRAFTDWTGQLLAQQLARYVCDLVTPTADVRVPISSWQATLTTTGECYAGCVIPAALQWTDTLEDATEFVISRRAELSDGQVIYVPVVRCPLDTLQVDSGPTNATASLSGYFDQITADDDPPAVYDRTLSGVRSFTTYNAGLRLRCEIDWLLRPGQRALYGDGQSTVVDYINYYVTSEGSAVQAYMDVGERL